MNIALITHVTPAESNGLSQYIRFLIRGLQEIDSSHHFYIFVNKSFDAYLNIDHPRFNKVLVDIPHYPRGLMRPVYFFWQNFVAGKLLKKYRIDLVHLPNPIPLFNTYGIPHIVTIHDTAELRGARHNRLHRNFRIAVNNISAKKSNQVLTVSEFSKREIVDLMGIRENKINVTHPGLTLDLKKGVSENIKVDKSYFLSFGGHKENKNLDRLIEAFLSLNVKKKVKLVLVGDLSKLRESFDLNLLNENGVDIKGYVSEHDLIGYYRNALALVYPSLYEGFGLPVLEAMSLGTPVISSSRASMPEVGGDAVLYIDPEDSTSIKNAMLRILSDKKFRSDLKKRGMKRSRNFNWKVAAQKTIIAYEKAVEHRD